MAQLSQTTGPLDYITCLRILQHGLLETAKLLVAQVIGTIFSECWQLNEQGFHG